MRGVLVRGVLVRGVLVRGVLVRGVLVGCRSRLPEALVRPRRRPSCLVAGRHRYPRPCPRLSRPGPCLRRSPSGRHPRQLGWPPVAKLTRTSGRRASERQGFRRRKRRPRACPRRLRRLLRSRRAECCRSKPPDGSSIRGPARRTSSGRARTCARRRSERGGKACRISRYLNACSPIT